jgi:hypothetical protein
MWLKLRVSIFGKGGGVLNKEQPRLIRTNQPPKKPRINNQLLSSLCLVSPMLQDDWQINRTLCDSDNYGEG